MDADKLVKMANDIAAFFASEPDPATAIESVASHLKRFWEPRMRRAILSRLDDAGDGGMHPLVAAALRDHRSLLEPQG